MDLSNPKTWTDGVSVVVGGPHIITPLLLTVSACVWWFRGTVERAKRDGLQSIIDGRDAKISALTQQIEVREERLQLAIDAHKDLSTKLIDAKMEAEKLKQQIEQKACPEAIATTAKSTTKLLTDTGTVNNALRHVLSGTHTAYRGRRVEDPAGRPTPQGRDRKNPDGTPTGCGDE